MKSEKKNPAGIVIRFISSPVKCFNFETSNWSRSTTVGTLAISTGKHVRCNGSARKQIRQTLRRGLSLTSQSEYRRGYFSRLRRAELKTKRNGSLKNKGL